MLQHLMLLYRLRTLGEAGASAAYTTFRTWDFDAQGYGTGRWSINWRVQLRGGIESSAQR